MGGFFIKDLFRLNHITKKYQFGNDFTYALNNVSLSFPTVGLICIVGASGSGKSTLLNMLALIDKPSSGDIYFNNENTKKWSQKRRCVFHNIDSSLLFQNYQLIENETVISNVMMPLLIKGISKKHAEKDAKILLEKVGINNNQYLQKCRDLSGGEKERVSLARSVINLPKVIFADEPTGALDSNNSINVMDILKKLSKKRLVIIVSHNENLVYQYADRIIKLSDGQVIDDYYRHKITDEMPILKSKFKRTNFFTTFGLKNLFVQFKRNIISFLSLCFSICMALIVVGFSNGATKSFDNLTNQLFDIGTCTLSYEEKTTLSESSISITRTRRPTTLELNDFKATYEDFEISTDYRYLISKYPKVLINNKALNDFEFNPICCFQYPYVDPNMVYKGKVPKDTLNEVAINNIAYESIRKLINSDPINCSLIINSTATSEYYDNEKDVLITDYFNFEKRMKIVGVCKETTLLNTPKIYFSNAAMCEYLNEIILNNLSAYLKEDITWLQRIELVDGTSKLSNYDMFAFYKDVTNIHALIEDIDSSKKLTISSTTIDLKNAILDLSNAAVVGLEMFFIVSFIGLIIVLVISSISNYLKDKKNNAILVSLGASSSQIQEIYVVQNLCIVLVSIIMGIVLSIGLSSLINNLLLVTIGVSNVIKIPLLIWKGKKFLLPILLTVSTILVSIVTTCLPIIFSSKISIKEELQNND